MNDIIKYIQTYIEDKFSTLFDNIPANTTDIVINPDNKIFLYCSDNKIIPVENNIDIRTLQRISYMLSSLNNNSLNKNHPSLSCILPKRGYRLEILIPPVVKNITISIRIPNYNIITLQELYKNNMFTTQEYEKLKELIKTGKNIVISGETGSGKTTLLSALINEIDKNERLIIIEENIKEINCINNNNIVNLITNKSSFTGQDAIISSLRMNPDRIIYGETRDGKSCLEMLKSWRTGHNGGLCTIHAKSAKEVKNRIKDLLNETNFNCMDNLIDSTIDAVIQLSFDNKNNRKINQIKLFN